MAVKTGVMGSSEPALVFSVVAFLCSLNMAQTQNFCQIIGKEEARDLDQHNYDEMDRVKIRCRCRSELYALLYSLWKAHK